MAAPDRDKLRAGLAGILSGGDAEAPGVEAATEPSPKSATPVPTRKPSESSSHKSKGGPAKVGLRAKAVATLEPEPDGGDHVRTSTGYVKADGEQVHRVSLMLTKGERRALRNRAEEAELSMTDYVRQALGL